MGLHTAEMAEQRRKAYTERVYKVLQNEIGISKRENNFSVDSLESVALIMGFEDEFGITIDDKDATSLMGAKDFLVLESTNPTVPVSTIVDYLLTRKDIR